MSLVSASKKAWRSGYLLEGRIVLQQSIDLFNLDNSPSWKLTDLTNKLQVFSFRLCVYLQHDQREILMPFRKNLYPKTAGHKIQSTIITSSIPCPSNSKIAASSLARIHQGTKKKRNLQHLTTRMCNQVSDHSQPVAMSLDVLVQVVLSSDVRCLITTAWTALPPSKPSLTIS